MALTNGNLIKVDGTPTGSNQQMEDAGEIVTSITAPGSDEKFPTEQATVEYFAAKTNVLEKDNTTVFTPDADYEPATKKYVDDNVGGSGDMLKTTYDPTTVEGDAFDMDNMVEGTNNKILTSTERTKLNNTSGTNTGDQSASDFNHDDLSAITGTAGQYNHPTDADMLVIGNTSGTNTGDQDLSSLALKTNVLEKDNTTEFTPTTNYHPATKKYVDDNAGGMQASIYDPTTVEGDAFDMDNMVEGTNNKILTSAERTKLNNTSGTNTGDQDLSSLALKTNVLEKDNTTSFTPASNYHPATKKYVDDSVSEAGGGDMLKTVYDPTTVEGDAFDMDNMVEGTNNKILTSAERTKLNNTSGTNTGDQDLSSLALKTNVLEKDNTTEFTPDADYEPATKKYVDDNIGGGSGDVIGPAANTDGYLPQWDGTDSKTLKNGKNVVTTVATSPTDNDIPTSQAVREAIESARNQAFDTLDLYVSTLVVDDIATFSTTFEFDTVSKIVTKIVADTFGSEETSMTFSLLDNGSLSDILVLDSDGNITVTGNISLGGTVDGIDIATDVAANTAKVTNATHTGDVTGSTALTIADDAVTYAKMQNVVANNVLLGNNAGAGGAVDELTATEVRTLINVEDGAEANNISDTNATALTDGGSTTLHGHTASSISDFDTEVSNNTSVAANTAKVTNATHTGDVTGDEALTIADDAVTYAKMQNVVANNVLLGNNAGAGGAVTELGAADVRTLINVEDGAEANNINDTNATDLTDGNDSTLHYHAADRNRANHTGTQAASTISDFDTEVSNNTAVTANTAKVTNATHTGDATGDGALTIATDLRTVQVDLVIPGAFMDGRSVGDDLLEKVNSHLFLWRLRAGVLKSFKAIVLVDDTGGTQPQINLEIGGTEALSSDLTLAETWSTGTINTSNDDVSTSDRLEITVANTGTNSDAEDLTVSMTWEVTSV